MKNARNIPDLFFYMDEEEVKKELAKNKKSKIKGKKGGRVYKQKIIQSERSRNQLLQQ